MRTRAAQRPLSSLLVAHRGDPSRYPENSLPGFRSALESGARFVETDIQFTADRIAVLSHDVSLARVSGENLPIPETPYGRLQSASTHEPRRFGERYAGLRIASLDEFVLLLRDWPQAHAFIEIKEQSYARFGERMTRQIVEQLEPIRQQCTLISYVNEVCETASAMGNLTYGWILPAWTDEMRQTVSRLQPDYIFINAKRLLPAGQPLWPGNWRWVSYSHNRLDEIRRMERRGFDLIETNDIATLLQAEQTKVPT